MSQPTEPIVLIPERVTELEHIHLEAGGHEPDHSFCFMEALAYIAGERWSDHPACASKVLGAFIRPINDWMNDDERQLLKPYLVRTFGTVGTKSQEGKRVFMLADWAIHFCAPLALDVIKHGGDAAKLRALPPIVDKAAAKAAAKAAYAAANAANAAYAAYAAAYAAKAAANAADAADAAACAAANAANAAANAAKAAAYAAIPQRQAIVDDMLRFLDQLITVTEATGVAQ